MQNIGVCRGAANRTAIRSLVGATEQQGWDSDAAQQRK